MRLVMMMLVAAESNWHRSKRFVTTRLSASMPQPSDIFIITAVSGPKGGIWTLLFSKVVSFYLY